MGIAHGKPPPAHMDLAAISGTDAGGDLIKEPGTLLDALRRLRVLNDGVMFYNREKTIKFMLRNDPSDLEALACELVIVFEDDDDVMNRIVDLCNLGCLEEPGMYVIHTWSYAVADIVTPQDVEPAMQAINRAYRLRVCPCAAAFIQDDAPLCLLCQLTSTQADREKHFCSICYEDGMRMHMTHMPCCKQHLHAACLKTWHAKAEEDAPRRCPLCRAGC